MGKDYQLRKNFFFAFHFFLKIEPSGRLILIKDIYYYYWNRFYRLVEMSFRNHLLVCVATVAVSCRKKLSMQSLILANINLISG